MSVFKIVLNNVNIIANEMTVVAKATVKAHTTLEGPGPQKVQKYVAKTSSETFKSADIEAVGRVLDIAAKKISSDLFWGKIAKINDIPKLPGSTRTKAIQFTVMIGFIFAERLIEKHLMAGDTPKPSPSLPNKNLIIEHATPSKSLFFQSKLIKNNLFSSIDLKQKDSLILDFAETAKIPFTEVSDAMKDIEKTNLRLLNDENILKGLISVEGMENDSGELAKEELKGLLQCLDPQLLAPYGTHKGIGVVLDEPMESIVTRNVTELLATFKKENTKGISSKIVPPKHKSSS